MFSVLAVTPWKTAEDDNFRIARDSKQKFSLQKDLNGCHQRIMKIRGKVLKREHFIV